MTHLLTSPTTLAQTLPTSLDPTPTSLSATSDYAYSASATAPILLSFHLPFLLLGVSARTCRPPLDTLYYALARGLAAAGEEEGKDVVELVLRDGEEPGGRGDAWVLRDTPTGEYSQEGEVPWIGFRAGDGLPTPEESSVLERHGVWAFPFVLERRGILLSRREHWAREIETVMRCLRALCIPAYMGSSGGKDDAGEWTAIVGERCSPHVSLRLASSVGTVAADAKAWDEKTVPDLLVLLAAFEREMCALATPEWLVAFQPLSVFFLAREVRKVRRGRKELWRGLGGEREGADGEDGEAEETEKGGRFRKRKAWDRVVRRWFGEMAEGDERAERRRELLGEEGSGWWEYVHGEMQRGDKCADIVRHIGRRTVGGRGARLIVGLEVHCDAEAEVKDEEGGGGDKKFPHIPSLVFPVPFRTLDPAPLVAYIELLWHIVLFADESALDAVIRWASSARRDSLRAAETSAETLSILAEGVKLEVAARDVLVADIARFSSGELDARVKGMRRAGGALAEVQRFVQGRYEEGRRWVVRVTQGGGEGGGVGMLGFVERYGCARGWLVPSREVVYEIMVKGERGRKRGEGVVAV